MGLIHNLVIGVMHLLLVAMDILAIMILIKVIYERWRTKWLRQINNTVEPVIVSIMEFVYRTTKWTTGRTYTDKMLIVIFILCLSLVRLIICGLM